MGEFSFFKKPQGEIYNSLQIQLQYRDKIKIKHKKKLGEETAFQKSFYYNLQTFFHVQKFSPISQHG